MRSSADIHRGDKLIDSTARGDDIIIHMVLDEGVGAGVAGVGAGVGVGVGAGVGAGAGARVAL